MSSEIKNNLKVRAAIAIMAAVLAVVILSGYIYETTMAKYRSQIDGYTYMVPAEFHAMLLGDETKATLTEKWESGSSASLFGEEISIEILQPGGESEVIPFMLVNSTDTDKISGVDIEYGLSVRTTQNLPLVFTLTRAVASGSVTNSNAVNSDGLEVFKTGSLCVVETGAVGDAPRYAYPFYRVLSSGMEGETLESAPFVFRLEGGKISSDEFKLYIDWPIIHDENTKNTDDFSYMKEVDIIEILADMVSTDRRKDYIGSGAVDSSAIIMPIPIVHDYHGTGLVMVYPGADYSSKTTGEWGGETDYTYRYNLSHYAFGPVNEVLFSSAIGETFEVSTDAVNKELPFSISKSATSSAYKLKVTNGNGPYDLQGEMVADNYSEVTNLKARIYVPLTKDTIGSDGVLKTKVSVLTQFSDGSVRLATISRFDAKTATRYDIETGQFTEIGTNKLAEIGEIVNSSAYNIETQRYRYYFRSELAMIIEGTGDENTGTVKNYYYYYNYQLDNYDDDGKVKYDYVSFIILTDLSVDQMADLPAYNEFFVEIIAMFPHGPDNTVTETTAEETTAEITAAEETTAPAG